VQRSSSGAARLAIAHAELAISPGQQEPVEGEALSGSIDAELRSIFHGDIRQWTNHAVTGFRDGLEEIRISIFAKHDPDMTAVLAGNRRIPRQASPRYQIGVVSELDEFSPGPECMIFAIALSQPLKRAWMLPKVLL